MLASAAPRRAGGSLFNEGTRIIKIITPKLRRAPELERPNPNQNPRLELRLALEPRARINQRAHERSAPARNGGVA